MAAELLQGNPTSGKNIHRIAHFVTLTLQNSIQIQDGCLSVQRLSEDHRLPFILAVGTKEMGHFSTASYNQGKTEKAGFPAKQPFFTARQVKTTLRYRCVQGEKWYII